ncbi:hypothetical protein ANOBCDAF_01520 [Pleomorphomonas sp. T1.2MG-36]|nr:hypothetical protein ANOBCDAF_01520 [Pleomorphomonas sp. T1.2MG-36]
MLGSECRHEEKGQSVCKPGSVSGFPPDDHSSGTSVAERLVQPTRTTDPETGWAEARVIPIRSCSRWGLPCRSRYRARGGLLHHLFTLTPAHRGGSISVALSLRSPSPGVTRHRVSVEPGLSSRTGFRPLSARSSNRLAGAVWHAPAGRSSLVLSASVAGRPPAFGFRAARGHRLAPEAARSGFGYQPQSPAALRALAFALRAGAAWRRKPQDAASVISLSRRQRSAPWLSRCAQAPLGAGSRKTRLRLSASIAGRPPAFGFRAARGRRLAPEAARRGFRARRRRWSLPSSRRGTCGSCASRRGRRCSGEWCRRYRRRPACRRRPGRPCPT